ncbi:MAG: electron transfer flavoprotein subunit alpha/FixB family protein [Bacteroidales bacterium]|nr:electron transfer flavoprotein subunit alpha/FixB family protein [Bacteroidales bacterium]
MSVLVYTENQGGRFRKHIFELVSYASETAKMLNSTVTALSTGKVDESELMKLGNYGANRIISVENSLPSGFDNRAYSYVVSEVARKTGATVIILSDNHSGKAIAPGLSVRLKAAVGSGVSRLPVSTEPFVVCKRVFSGNAFAHVVLKTPVRIITLARNSFSCIESAGNPAVERMEIPVDGTLVRTTVREVIPQSGRIQLTDADIVVSGGRGMKAPGNWAPLLELAEGLGAATACSRPVSDEGWRPHEEHAGQTGRIIAPNLYIAVGISGATQHLAGVSSSKYIVAINTDRDAPIFEAAQYGIVGDAMKVLPKLTEAIKKR